MPEMPLGPLVRFGPVSAVEVVHGDAEDLTEAEGDDGEVVAAQPQGGRADDDAEDVATHGADQHDDGRTAVCSRSWRTAEPETRAAV